MTRFHALDAFRGIAALAIVLLHLGVNVRTSWMPTAEQLYLLVDFFFVLSGFVIAHAYRSRISNRGEASVFLLRRVGRVLPLHLAMMAVLLVIELAKVGVATLGIANLNPFGGFAVPGNFLFDVFLLNSFGLTGALSWNVPSWSISAELGAYLLFAAIVATGLPFRMACLVVVAGSMALLVALSPQGMSVTFELGLLRCLAGFFTGCLVYETYLFAKPRFTAPWGSAAEFAALTVCIAFLAWAGDGYVSFFAPVVFGMMVYIFSGEAGLFRSC